MNIYILYQHVTGKYKMEALENEVLRKTLGPEMKSAANLGCYITRKCDLYTSSEVVRMMQLRSL
jgi:hypothetical protein